MKGVSDNPAEYTVEDEFTLANPTRLGWEFAGWSGSNNDEPSMAVTVSNSTGDLTYTANWEESKGDATTPLATDDIDDIDNNGDLPEFCSVELTLSSDISRSITVPQAVTNLVLVFAGSEPVTIQSENAALAPIVLGNSKCSLSVKGRFNLKAAESTGPVLMGAGGATLRLMTASAGLTAVASPGKAGLADGAAVEVAGIEKDADNATCQVSFRVRLGEGQDFNAWLHRANLASLIKIRYATTLADLVDNSANATTINAAVSGVEIEGDADERLVTFSLPIPESVAACFFVVEIE